MMLCQTGLLSQSITIRTGRVTIRSVAFLLPRNGGMDSEDTQVLNVGAGVAGLSLSLLLCQQGIRPVLIERRRDISWYPRARNSTFARRKCCVASDSTTKFTRPWDMSRAFSRASPSRHVKSGKSSIPRPSWIRARSARNPSSGIADQTRLEPILIDCGRQRQSNRNAAPRRRTFSPARIKRSPIGWRAETDCRRYS
jgi:cation diffusion facilitator CzcD-associated flavoprotein CzcO